MFTINQGFDLNSPQFNFKRDYFASVADLKAAPETSFPDHFITNVAGVLYQLTKSNSVDTTTGKWRKVQLGSDVDLSNYAQKSELNKYNQALKSISFNNGKGITGTNINNTIVNLGSINDATDSSDGLMSATDKAKLDGIAVGANKYVLPVASATALGGIMLGDGLIATNDGTVSVSTDIVAGSVEWDNITNKPDVATLYADDGNETGTNVNAAIKFLDTSTGNSTVIDANVINVNAGKGNNSISIQPTGIHMIVNGSPNVRKIFLTDGTTQELTAITTEELNKILV